MLSAGHSLRQDQGLVGQAATTKEPVLISDVTQDANWLPNPLLPDTKAETAVPIIYGSTLLGVLDVQHNIVGGLTEEDVELLQSIAAQVAVALRNARLYEQSQQRAVQESIANQISLRIKMRQTWKVCCTLPRKNWGRR
jgi:GAF domain-containing protein